MADSADNCVFCRIARGDLPCTAVAQSEAALAFLDIAPLAEAHVLLIPRAHYATLDDMPPPALAEVTTLLPALGRAVREVTAAPGYNVLQNNGSVAGQAVAHVHFHVIPRREGDGLGYRWKPRSYEGDRAEQLATRLRDALARI